MVLGRDGRAPGCSGSTSAPTARAPGLLSVPAAGIAPSQGEAPYVQMNGPEVYKFATHVVVESAVRCLDAAGLTVEDVDLFLPHQANQRIIDHAARRLGIPDERVFCNVAQYGNTSAASIPLALDEAYRGGVVNARRHRADGRLRRRPGVGIVRDGMDEGALMAKIAFCFPGQGSQRVGMGSELVQQFPEAAAVFAEASDVLGFDLGKVCFDGPIEELSRTELTQPALVTTSIAALRAVAGAHRPGARRRGRPQRRRVRRAVRGGRCRPGVGGQAGPRARAW